MTDTPEVLIASKSEWYPAIRREHQLARLAAAHHHRVSFVERPRDIRSLRVMGPSHWLRCAVVPRQTVVDEIRIIQRAALLPAHLHRRLEGQENWGLHRAILGQIPRGSTIVITLPWQWPAISGLDGYRRVLDVADNWTALLPSRARRLRELYARAGAEADAISVVSEPLRELFPDRRVDLVRNGLDASLLADDASLPPMQHRLAYLGTLSERFDAPVIAEMLEELPAWTLDLFGPCAYARRGDRPGDELVRLLDRFPDRVRWHGPVGREAVAGVLDSADVLLLPNRVIARGQDSMKIYDYTARGRPVVATAVSVEGISDQPPHMLLASSPSELADRVQEAVSEPAAHRAERLAWARDQTWQARWQRWSEVLFADRAQADHGLSPVLGTSGLVSGPQWSQDV